MSIIPEPFQRTDISMKPLGLTISEMLSCGFKTKGEKSKYHKEEKNKNNIENRALANP